jgi:hypothetical protein
MANGVDTGKFGLWLSQYVQHADKLNQYKVFYDHGEKYSDLGAVAIKGFYGEQVTNTNRLADIDLLVADQQGNAKLLIEIEEHQSSPKKIIGDVFAIAMCNRIEVKQAGVRTTFHLTPETVLIVAGIVNPHGAKLTQASGVIYPRIHSFSAPQDGLQLENVQLMFHSNLKCTIESLKEQVLKILNI